MLEKFRTAKQAEIENLRAMDQAGTLADLWTRPRPPFAQALRDRAAAEGVAVIAEYKRASPSKGDINLAFTPGQVAELYAKSGAAAISVLTEEVYFKGSLDYLGIMAASNLPLLRKDFLFHPLQVRQTASTSASALLLIARMFRSATELARMLNLAEGFGLEAVTEVFDRADLDRAREAGADIIQVNNRDLDTMTISLDNSRTLVRERSDRELWISASGISEPHEVKEMAGLGFTAVLVGTSIMASGDPGDKLRQLAQGAKA